MEMWGTAGWLRESFGPSVSEENALVTAQESSGRRATPVLLLYSNIGELTYLIFWLVPEHYSSRLT